MKPFFCLTLLCLTAVAAGFAAERPNVILILADDMAIGDLSLFNEGRSRTPRLDALIGESVYFENAYSGSPVCAPSRAALLTGRFPHRTGSVTLNQIKYPELTRLHLDETTIADVFSANGYATGLVGKWHSGPGAEYHPLKRGFDEYTGFNDSTDIKTYFKYQLDIQGEYKPFEGPNLTDVFTERAIDFVKRNKEKPFFLHLAHYAPHRPLSAPQELIDYYLGKGLPEKTATVYAMVEVMDKGIGQLLDELDALGIAEKTLVFFASDNGPDPLVGDRFNGQNRGTKYMAYEGGIHVPLMFRWPGTLPAQKRSETIHFVDIFPTLIKVCGLKQDGDVKPLDGVSIAGLLSDNYAAPTLPEFRFWQWNRKTPDYSHNAAVRFGPWKLVRPFVTSNIPKTPSTETPLLYNLAEDPQEETDRAVDNPELYQRLTEKLNTWSAEVERDRLQSQPKP